MPDSSEPSYKRILLKLSGESLMADRSYGISPAMLEAYARDIRSVTEIGVQVAVVIGGGNIYRGMNEAETGIERAQGDYMGMLATVINGMALQAALEKAGVNTRLQSAIKMEQIAEPYIRRRAIRHMEKGRVVIFAAGTGNPFFTTDTAAALRASEMGCEALLKGTKVDGVYSADPKLQPDATHFPRLTHHEVLSRDLKVMDAAAISLARENKIPIIVFSIHKPGNFARVMLGQGMHTIIGDAPLRAANA